MNVVVHQFVADAPQAIAVWLAVVGLAVATVLAISAPSWRERGLRVWVRIAASRVRQDRRRDTVERACRRADELAAAAARAAVEADRLRAQWRTVRASTDAAWQAFDAGDRAARHALDGAGYARPLDDLDDQRIDEHRRMLRRLASDAYRRGDLSEQQLADVFTERPGWDPRRHPADLVVELHGAVREHRWQRFLTAQAEERAAWHAADVASAARTNLAREAAHAALRVAQLTRPEPAPAAERVAGRGMLSRPAE